MQDPDPRTRLALLKARAWIGDHSKDAHCNEVQDIAQHLEDDSESLYELAQCTDDALERLSLLQKVLSIEPRHHNALKSLTMFISYTDHDYGISPDTLAKHRAAFYDVAKHVDYKISAAVFICEAAIDHGHGAAAHAIRDRLAHDLDLEGLDYGPGVRAGSLNRVCSTPIFNLDLEDICVSAIQKLAARSVATGTSIPDDVLAHLEHAFEQFNYAQCRRVVPVRFGNVYAKF